MVLHFFTLRHFFILFDFEPTYINAVQNGIANGRRQPGLVCSIGRIRFSESVTWCTLYTYSKDICTVSDVLPANATGKDHVGDQAGANHAAVLSCHTPFELYEARVTDHMVF